MRSALMFNRTLKEGDDASMKVCTINPGWLEIPKFICSRVAAEF